MTVSVFTTYSSVKVFWPNTSRLYFFMPVRFYLFLWLYRVALLIFWFCAKTAHNSNCQNGRQKKKRKKDEKRTTLHLVILQIVTWDMCLGLKACMIIGLPVLRLHFTDLTEFGISFVRYNIDKKVIYISHYFNCV